MALQGSIDTFALDDVLRLVASTSKTGRLTLTGTRGTGEVAVSDGQVVGIDVSTDARSTELHELVFELMRFDDGDFQFDAMDLEVDDSVQPAQVDDLLTGAFELLEEWREIEKFVPRSDSSVRLSSSAPNEAVTVQPEQWQLIAAVGSAAPVSTLSARLDASELAVGRVLRPLIEAGLVVIGDPMTADEAGDAHHGTEGYSDFVAPLPARKGHDTNGNGASTNGNGVSTNGASANGASDGNGSSGANGSEPIDASALFDAVPSDVTADMTAEVPAAVAVAAEGYEPMDAGEFARRLADLSPRAAKAVAAAARAATTEERDAALAELDETGESVDHDLLLHLLGPVEG